MSRRALVLMFSSIPFCTNSLKPFAEAVNSYVPVGRLGKLNKPSCPVTVLDTAFVPTEVAVMSTPGTTAPLGSVTVPLIDELKL
jgi:hypothetical protein